MPYNAGTAFLQVVPSFKGVQKAIRRELNKIGAEGGVESGREFAGAFEKTVRALLDKTLRLDLSTAGAMAELQRVREELDRLGAESPDIAVRVDAAIASAEVNRMQTQVERLDGQEANIRVDADTGAARANLASVGNEAYRSAGSVSALAIVGASLGPLIVPAAAVAVAGILAIGSAAAVGIGAVGVLTLGFSGIGDAVSALGDAQDDAGKRAAKAASSHLQVANAVDGVRSAEASLANTRANASEGARRAADQVRDAERSLAEAQATARLAQVALTEARADARRALEDMNRSLKQGALDQRQATLDQSKAKADLDKVLSDPKATEQQRQQAQLTYDQATQRLEDIAVRQKRLSADAAKANKAGVEGSKQVQSAHQGVRKAQDGIASAQERLADAVRAQTTQQRQQAFALAQAQQGVVSAQRALTQATMQAGAQGAASMDKLKKAMDALTPAGRSFALFLFGLKPIFKQLKAAAEGGLLPGVEAGIRAVLPIMPTIVNLVRVLASAMGELFKRAGQALASPFWVDFFNFIAAQAGPAIRDFGSIMGNLARVFAVLMKAFAPVTQQIGAGLVTLTKRFADFITKVVSGRGFQQFIDYLIVNGPMLTQLFIDLATITIKLLVGLAPLASQMLRLALSATKFLAALPPETLGKIAVAIIAVVLGFQALQTVIAIVSAVSAAVAFLMSPIGLVIIAVVAFIAIWVLAYTKLDWFRRAVNMWFRAIGTTARWLWKEALVPAFQGIVSFVRTVVAPAFMWLWRNVIVPAWTGIRFAIQVAWALIKVIFGIIQINLKILGAAFLALYRNVIKPVWENGIRPVFRALGDFISRNVAPAFKTGVSAIARAWDALREAAKKPVGFVINRVIEGGILAAYNAVAGKFPGVGQVHLPGSLLAQFKGYAAGGPVWGGQRGKDSVPALLMPDEHVWTTREVAAAGGHGAMHRLRQAALDGTLGYFADGGGVFGKLSERFKATLSGIVGGGQRLVAGSLEHLLKPLAGLAKQLVQAMPGGKTGFGQLVGAVPSRMVDGLLAFVRGKDKEAAGSFAGGAFAGRRGGWPPRNADGSMAGNTLAAQGFIRKKWPGLDVGTYVSSKLWSDHHWGKALDIMMPKMGAKVGYDIANWFVNNPNAFGTKYLIYAGRFNQGKGWGPYTPPPGNGMHYDHVHLSLFDQGGYLQPGLNIAYNGTGRPEPVLTSRQFADMSRDRGGDMTLRVLVDDGAVRGLVRVEVDEAHGALANAMIYRIGG